MFSNQMIISIVFLYLGIADGFPTESETRLDLQKSSRLLEDEMLATSANGEGERDFRNGLTEIKEEEIPEGAFVYVVEENDPSENDEESLRTADNIVFRPLFQYRRKQEARRRLSNNSRRRYYVSRRPYRQAYYPRYRYRYYSY